MSTILCPMPKAQFFDALGAPLAGGRLYTYAPGAPGTPKATYTDDTGGTPNTNPVVLDSSGRANIWLDGAYYMELWTGVKTSPGSTLVWTQDNVSGNLFGAIDTGAITCTSLTSSGAITGNDLITKGPWVDVRAYGATGDGVTDDSAAIQAAITEAVATGKTVLFPSGAWHTAAQLNVTNPCRIVFDEGASLTATAAFVGSAVFKVTGDGVYFTKPVIDATNVPPLGAAYDGSQAELGMGVYFLGTSGDHLSFGGVTGGSITGAPFSGVLVKYADDITIDGVTITNAGSELTDLSPGAIYFVFSARPTALNNKILTPGLKGIVAGTGGDDALFQGNYVADGQTSGFAAYMVSNSKGWRCIGNKSKSIFGIKFDGGATQAADFTIMGNSIEDADNGGIIIQGGSSGQVVSNTINGWSKTDNEAGIEIFGDPSNPQSVGPLLISGNTLRFSGTAANGSNGISVYSASTYGPAADISIFDNYVEGAYTGVFTRTGTGPSFSRIRVARNTIKNCVYDGIGLKGQGIDVDENTILDPGNNGIFYTGTAGDTATDGVGIRDNLISSPVAYGVYVHDDAIATSLDIRGNRIDAADIGIIFYLATVEDVNIYRNRVIGTSGATSISLQAKASTTHTVHIDENSLAKTITWTPGSGTFQGTARWNKLGTAMTTAPAGVVCEDRGTGAPSIHRPVGSVFHRTDGGAGTSLYIKEAGTDGSGWAAK